MNNFNNKGGFMNSYVRNFSNFGRINTANDLDAFIPEIWSRETLAILQESMVVANLVHRDFENEIANFGDVVNTRQPSEFTAKRKAQTDDVTVQDANATNVQVPLNQWAHTSFMIRDGDLSKSMVDLIPIYIQPAALSLGRLVDRALLAQYAAFYQNSGGALGGLTSANAVQYLVETRKVMNDNKAYPENRNLIVGSYTEAVMLQNSAFTEAQKIGDNGTAVRNASLGRLLGFDIFMCQNMASIATPASTLYKNGAINLTAGYPKGTTSALVVGSFTGLVAAGNWLTINGIPYQASAVSATLGNTTGITVVGGLRAAVANADVVKTYVATTVNFGAGYAAGYAQYITLTSTTGLAVGQILSFGVTSGTAIYTIIDIVGSTVLLDRPLDAALVDTTAANPGPAGDFNLAFHKDAMALVNRPLAPVAAGVGAKSGVSSAYGLSMRATLSYDANKQGHLITLDMLFGVKVLKSALGAVLLA
jgi:hypothetical protein